MEDIDDPNAVPPPPPPAPPEEPLPPPPSAPGADSLPDAMPAILGSGSSPVPPEAPAPPPPDSSQDADTLSLDAIGDIPPPPVPAPAIARHIPTGVAGAPGAPTFALPGTAGARPFRTPAFASQSRGPSFGPGIAVTGAAPSIAAGDVDEGYGGLGADDIGELLRRLAGGA